MIFFSLSYGTYGNWTSEKTSSGEAPKDIIALKKSFMLSCEIQFSGRYEHLLHLKLFFVLKLEMLSCVPVDFSFFQVGCSFVCLQPFYNLVSLGWHKIDFFFLSLSHYIQYYKLIFFFSKQVDQNKYYSEKLDSSIFSIIVENHFQYLYSRKSENLVNLIFVSYLLCLLLLLTIIVKRIVPSTHLPTRYL